MGKHGKKMKVFIDTNVIIDILEQREPFYEDSYKIIQLGLEGELETMMSAGDVTNVYYVIKKSLHDPKIAREKIFILSNYVKICKCVSDDITSALILFIPDYEDAVIAATARREKADFIITRDEKDFENSPVPAMNPTEFINKYFPA
jgi:predicted nucleic acid-binding protein